MISNWRTIRNILGAQEPGKKLLLTLIDKEGKIVSANRHMTRTMHLPHEHLSRRSFLELIHPFHIRDFQKALDETKKTNQPYTLELCLKNGYYHPMKWEVHALPDSKREDAYFCVGEKILDDTRLAKFNKLGEKSNQLFIETLHAGVLFQDEKGEIIAANQKIAEIFHITLEKLYQEKDIENSWNLQWPITDEEGNKVYFKDSPFSRALQTGQPVEQTLVIHLALTGEYRWYHYYSQPIFEEGNSKPFAVVSNIVDVTSQKKLTSQLLELDAILKNFLMQSPNLSWVVDDQTRLIFASRTFYKYFNLDPQKSIGMPIGDIVPRDVAEALRGRHFEAIESGKPIEVVEKTRLADGSNYIFHINLFPIEGIPGKRLLGGLAVSLAEKYAVEKQLRETNERLLLLTRATSDAIWEWDMQTGRIFRNDALMDMIGYQLDNPKGLSWWLRRIHPDDRNRVSDIVKDSTDHGRQSWQDEYRFKCADGSYKFMRDKGYIVYENGLPVKMIGSLQDITDIRTLEDKLMEEKIQRQKDISETVIRVQEKERTRIGHELHDNVNQILSTTKLFVDMLTPSSEEEMKLKEKSVNYLLMAIEEIRKLSKELVEPQLKEKNLATNIQSLIEDIHLSTNLEVKFTYDQEQDLLSQGKKITIFRIVQEQLKNIIKHSQATHVDIFLQNKTGEAQLSIRDNGVGFEPGQTSRGIGLSNIYERTRFYNGSTQIITAPGKGCQLEVMIPSD